MCRCILSILNIKGVNVRRILWGVSRNEAAGILNNFVLEGNSVL